MKSNIVLCQVDKGKLNNAPDMDQNYFAPLTGFKDFSLGKVKEVDLETQYKKGKGEINPH